MQNQAMREYNARRGWIIALMVREVNSGVAKRLSRERILDAAGRLLPLIHGLVRAILSWAPEGNLLRYLVALLVTLLCAACSRTPAPRGQLQPASPGQVSASDGQLDSLIRLLLAEAASDFHSHRPPSLAHVRNVRIGHVTTADGAKQYMLCGEFFPAQREGKAEWTPFATIQTSGYEQWLGAQGASLCQRSTVIWDSKRDLSSSLQTQLDSMR
jgi:hypothetical protein